MWKNVNSIQYTVPGFEPTTSRSLFISHNLLTRAPAHSSLYLNVEYVRKIHDFSNGNFLFVDVRPVLERNFVVKLRYSHFLPSWLADVRFPANQSVLKLVYYKLQI